MSMEDSCPRALANLEKDFKDLRVSPAEPVGVRGRRIVAESVKVELDRVDDPECKPTHYNVNKKSSDWLKKLTRIKIVQVVAPNKYIVAPLKYLDSDRIKSLEDKLEYEWGKMGSLVGEFGKNPDVGADVFVIFKNPGNCSRAKFKRGYVIKKKSFLSDLFYDVFLYDYCEVERIPVYRLKVLPNAYKELPPRFLYLTLPGICPTLANKLCDEKQFLLKKECKRPSFNDLLKVKIKDIIKSHKSNGAYFEFSYKYKNTDKINLYGDIFFVQDDKVLPQSLIQLLCEKENLIFSHELWRNQMLDEELDIVLVEDIEPVEATRKRYYGYFPFEATRPSYI